MEEAEDRPMVRNAKDDVEKNKLVLGDGSVDLDRPAQEQPAEITHGASW